MVHYFARTVDTELDALLPELAAISIDGPKGVGKTVTARRRAAAVIALDDADQLDLLAADPHRLARLPAPVLIDEWQRYPPVWDLVRREVDRDPSGGRFLLTGSALPESASIHSGAGRIVRLRMRPMSFSERSLVPPTVSLGDLLSGSRPPITGESPFGILDYANELVGSGYPGIRSLPARALRAQLDSYLTMIVERAFADQGRPVRRPTVLRAWLAAYAAATSTTASYTSILDAATPGEVDKPAKTTTIAYRDVLTQLWLLDPIPGWLPVGSPLTRLAQAPKHHLVDPSLAARLLGVDGPALVAGAKPGAAGRLAVSGTLLGRLFESLVTLDVRVGAQAVEASTFHLRTKDGDHEIDLIVERDDHRVLALEVKLGAGVTDADVHHLKWLGSRIGDGLLDAAVITTGPTAYRRPDGIAVIPAALLGS
jgi:hypothetical protein